MKVSIILFIILLTFSAYSQDKKKTEIISVEPYLALSYGAFYKNLSLKSEDKTIDYIEGFNFEWGYSYKLKVLITHLQNPKQDASDITYKLINIVSKTKVSTNYQFLLRLEKDLYLGPGDQSSTFEMINDSTYNYLKNIEIIVPNRLKDEFNKVFSEGVSIYGRFEFVNNKQIRLIGFE